MVGRSGAWQELVVDQKMRWYCSQCAPLNTVDERCEGLLNDAKERCNVMHGTGSSQSSSWSVQGPVAKLHLSSTLQEYYKFWAWA